MNNYPPGMSRSDWDYIDYGMPREDVPLHNLYEKIYEDDAVWKQYCEETGTDPESDADEDYYDYCFDLAQQELRKKKEDY